MKKNISGVKHEIDGDEVYIDVPAGHVGDKLRFFVVFTALKGNTINPSQKEAIGRQLKGSMTWHHCEVEKIEWHKRYVLASLLMPWDVAPQTPIDAFLDFASTRDKVLRYHFMLNSAAKPTSKDINWYLKDVANFNHSDRIDD